MQLAGRFFRWVFGGRRRFRQPVRAGLGIGVRPWLLAAADPPTLSPVAAFPCGSIGLRAGGSALGRYRQLRATSLRALARPAGVVFCYFAP